MRLKLSYNFLRSGCSFCYRDIFSGLSNEKWDTALYSLKILHTSCSDIAAPALSIPFSLINTRHCLFKLFRKWLHLLPAFGASNKTNTMQNIKSGLGERIAYYLPLLQRYAVFIIKNEDAAAELVKQVLEDQYEMDELLPSAHLRQVLKTKLRNRCFAWLQSQILSKPRIHPYNNAGNASSIINNESSVDVFIPVRNGNVNPIVQWLKNLYERKPKDPT